MDRKQADIFVEQLKEVFCAETITMETDIMCIADIFNHVDTGKFIAFDIDVNKVLEGINAIKQEIRGAHIFLIRVVGDIYLYDVYDIGEEIANNSDNNDFFITGTYDNSFQSHHARVLIWYNMSYYLCSKCHNEIHY